MTIAIGLPGRILLRVLAGPVFRLAFSLTVPLWAGGSGGLLGQGGLGVQAGGVGGGPSIPLCWSALRLGWSVGRAPCLTRPVCPADVGRCAARGGEGRYTGVRTPRRARRLKFSPPAGPTGPHPNRLIGQ